MVLLDSRADRRVGDVEGRIIPSMGLDACVADAAASCVSCGSGASRVSLHGRVLPVGRSGGRSRTRLSDTRWNSPWFCEGPVEGASCPRRCIINSLQAGGIKLPNYEKVYCPGYVPHYCGAGLSSLPGIASPHR